MRTMGDGVEKKIARYGKAALCNHVLFRSLREKNLKDLREVWIGCIKESVSLIRYK